MVVSLSLSPYVFEYVCRFNRLLKDEWNSISIGHAEWNKKKIRKYNIIHKYTEKEHPDLPLQKRSLIPMFPKKTSYVPAYSNSLTFSFTHSLTNTLFVYVRLM